MYPLLLIFHSYLLITPIGTQVALPTAGRDLEMKRKEMYIVKAETTEQDNTPALAIIREIPLTRIKPVFDDCSLNDLEYFLERAVQQEEYELCKHLKDLIEMRYSFCVA